MQVSYKQLTAYNKKGRITMKKEHEDLLKEVDSLYHKAKLDNNLTALMCMLAPAEDDEDHNCIITCVGDKDLLASFITSILDDNDYIKAVVMFHLASSIQPTTMMQ